MAGPVVASPSPISVASAGNNAGKPNYSKSSTPPPSSSAPESKGASSGYGAWEAYAGFRHKAVRDLAWLVQCPSLLSAATGLELLAEPSDEQQVADTAAWLADLERSPEGLLEEISRQPNVRRLGFYAAALTEYWLRHGPAWGAQKFLTTVPLASPADPSGKRTAGQLKLVCSREEEILHVESSLKFFVDAIPAAALDSADCATEDGVSMRGSMARFVGPFLHENFAWRLNEAHRKLKSTTSSSVRSYLHTQLGKLPVRSAYFLKGFIFRPLKDFRPGFPWETPPELNAACPCGWYTSCVEELERVVLPGARLAVLPKLYWLGPAEAEGDPLRVVGCELPSQSDPVPVEPWHVLCEQVACHFKNYENALLICEMLPVPGDPTRWYEHSRGFILPPAWDPKELLTEGPTGMRTSSDGRAFSVHDQGFADARGRFSDRFADEKKSVPPDLCEAEIRIAQPIIEEQPVVVEDLIQLVLGSWNNRERCLRKHALQNSLRCLDMRSPGAACALACEALLHIAGQGLRTEGHVVLELLWRSTPLPQPDTPTLERLCQAGLSGDLCPRLVSRVFARFGTVPERVTTDIAAQHLESAMSSGDRHFTRGLIELLAAASSLRGDAVSLQLAAATDLITSAPADVKVIEDVCLAAPELLSSIRESLSASGQHRLAKKAEVAVSGSRPCTPSACSSERISSRERLQPMMLPSTVRSVLVADATALVQVRERVRDGGVVAVDAEWRPFTRRGQQQQSHENNDHRVQLLQLAWPEVVYVLDLPALGDEAALLLSDLLREEGCILIGYGLDGDIQRLADSYPGYMCKVDSQWRGIELSQLAAKAGFPCESLGALCRAALGQGLDKTLQCSDWSQRPLTQDQLQYASLDAWALLPLLQQLLTSDTVASASPGYDATAAEVSKEEATSAARVFRAPGLGGAAGVVHALNSLTADPNKAVLLASLPCMVDGGNNIVQGGCASTVSNHAVVGCKTVACVLTAGQNRAVLWVLCVLPSGAEVSLEQVAKVANGQGGTCGVDNHQANCRLASAEELRTVFRQPRGSIGPVGPVLLNGIGATVLLEESLLRLSSEADHVLQCGGGAPQWQLQVSPQYLQDFFGARVGHFLAVPSTAP